MCGQNFASVPDCHLPDCHYDPDNSGLLGITILFPFLPFFLKIYPSTHLNLNIYPFKFKN
jgi:hypothetical protein